MTKQRRREIFDILRAEKIMRVISPFSGGNDEGGAEYTECYGHSGEIIDFGPWEYIDEILSDVYGGFENEPIVSGTVTIDVKKETITIKASEGYTKYKNTKKEL